MTFEEVLKRVIFRWWLILIVTAIFTLSFFSWTRGNSYQASIGLGISFNNPAFVSTISGKTVGDVSNIGSEYSYSLSEFSKYLSARLSSVEVQMLVSQKAELGIAAFDPKSPFYTVTPQSGGFVSVSYENGSKEVTQRFIKAIKQVYTDIIKIERNNGELKPFQIEPKTEFVESTAEISKPVQFQILPTMAGLLVGIAVSAILPFKKF